MFGFICYIWLRTCRPRSVSRSFLVKFLNRIETKHRLIHPRRQRPTFRSEGDGRSRRGVKRGYIAIELPRCSVFFEIKRASLAFAFRLRPVGRIVLQEWGRRQNTENGRNGLYKYHFYVYLYCVIIRPSPISTRTKPLFPCGMLSLHATQMTKHLSGIVLAAYRWDNSLCLAKKSSNRSSFAAK